MATQESARSQSRFEEDAGETDAAVEMQPAAKESHGHRHSFKVPDLEANHHATNMPERTRGEIIGETLREAAEEANPFAVARLPITNRIDFRFKLLGLATLNIFGILFIAILFSMDGPLKDYFMKDFFIWNLASLLFFFMSMAIMTQSKEKYPLNYISLVLFTIFAGAYFGISNRAWGNNGNWQILGNLSTILVFFTFFATRTTPTSCGAKEGQVDSPAPVFTCRCVEAIMNGDANDETGILADLTRGPDHVPGGRRILFTLVAASSWAWFCQFVITLVLVIVTGYSDGGAYAALQIFSFLVSWYFSYDTQIIEDHYTPDQYMSGVVSFWADMVICVFCCICVAFFMGQ